MRKIGYIGFGVLGSQISEMIAWEKDKVEEFYFDDIVESIWRYFNKMWDYTNSEGEEKYYQHVKRLWRIYAVYDLDLDKLRAKKFKDYAERKDYLEEYGNIIGIFWDYERAWED